MDLKDFQAEESIYIAADPDTVFNTITDIKRTGEWSPVVETCWWESPHDGDPNVGDVFFGRNVTPERTWETRCEVTRVSRPTEFAWVVAGGVVHWGFTITPTEDGATLTEHWQLTEYGLKFFQEKHGDNAAAELENRRRAALEGIPTTLQRIKTIIESS